MSDMVKNVIEVRELNFSYAKHPFLTDINFTVKEGEVFGFLGPSGAGKRPDEGLGYTEKFRSNAGLHYRYRSFCL